MYAHVTTYRVGSSAEVADEIEWAAETGGPVSDQTARTIASYWHSPAPTSRALLALSHGRPFETGDLAAEISREIDHPDDRDVLAAWLENLDELLGADA